MANRKGNQLQNTPMTLVKRLFTPEILSLKVASAARLAEVMSTPERAMSRQKVSRLLIKMGLNTGELKEGKEKQNPLMSPEERANYLANQLTFQQFANLKEWADARRLDRPSKRKEAMTEKRVYHSEKRVKGQAAAERQLTLAEKQAQRQEGEAQYARLQALLNTEKKPAKKPTLKPQPQPQAPTASFLSGFKRTVKQNLAPGQVEGLARNVLGLNVPQGVDGTVAGLTNELHKQKELNEVQWAFNQLWRGLTNADQTNLERLFSGEANAEDQGTLVRELAQVWKAHRSPDDSGNGRVITDADFENDYPELEEG